MAAVAPSDRYPPERVPVRVHMIPEIAASTDVLLRAYGSGRLDFQRRSFVVSKCQAPGGLQPDACLWPDISRTFSSELS